jgi:transposase-like protein
MSPVSSRDHCTRFGPLPEATSAHPPCIYLDDVVISAQQAISRAPLIRSETFNEIVQIHRNAGASRRSLTRLLRKQGRPPKRIIIDELGSYPVAKRTIMSKIAQRQHQASNNRAENSQFPVRKRERMMQGFRSWRDCSGSFRPYQPSETISSRPALNAPPSQSTFIA